MGTGVGPQGCGKECWTRISPRAVDLAPGSHLSLLRLPGVMALIRASSWCYLFVRFVVATALSKDQSCDFLFCSEFPKRLLPVDPGLGAGSLCVLGGSVQPTHTCFPSW